MDTCCFHILAILNKAAMSRMNKYHIYTFNYFRCIFTSGIAGSHGNYIFNLGVCAIMSFIVVVPFYIFNSARGFQLFHILTNAYYFVYFF